MRYMGSFYQTQTLKNLKALRSKKFLRRTKLEHEPRTYLNMQELETLDNHITWIDAEIQCRADQMAFDLI